MDDAGWVMTRRFEASGYIEDDDAKDWDTGELLKSCREGYFSLNLVTALNELPAHQPAA